MKIEEACEFSLFFFITNNQGADMSKNDENKDYIFQDDYLIKVKEINDYFEKLSEELKAKGYTDTYYLLGVTYKSFSNEIFNEIKDK